jgi:Flp pilus assembly pilin Flp
MRRMLNRFWRDDEGAVISVELILVLSILIFGIIPGLVALRNSIIAALTNIGNAITSVVINVGVEDIAVQGGTPLNRQTIAYAGGFTITNTAGTQLVLAAQTPGSAALNALITTDAGPPTGFATLP